MWLLEIVDSSINPLADKEKYQNVIKVIMFANNKNDLPIVTNVGQIIRIHRAKINIY